jgi:hypothetical protein
MPRPAPARRTPPPRKKIVWLRAAPIFAGMMAVLFLGQYFLIPMLGPANPITANGGLGLSLVAGLLGAFLISRFATVTPPPAPSKSQQRKQAAAARAQERAEGEDEEEEETVAAVRPSSARRRRRRR